MKMTKKISELYQVIHTYHSLTKLNDSAIKFLKIFCIYEYFMFVNIY